MRSWSVALAVGLWAAGPALGQDVEADPDQVLPRELEADRSAPPPEAPPPASSANAPRGGTVLADDTPVKLPWSEVARLLAEARRARPERAPIPYAMGPARIEGEADGRVLVAR